MMTIRRALLWDASCKRLANELPPICCTNLPAPICLENQKSRFITTAICAATTTAGLVVLLLLSLQFALPPPLQDWWWCCCCQLLASSLLTSHNSSPDRSPPTTTLTPRPLSPHNLLTTRPRLASPCFLPFALTIGCHDAFALS